MLYVDCDYGQTMILKWIALIVLGVLIYWFVKQVRQTNQQDNNHRTAIEDMVCCAHCGVHLPKSESIASQGKYFCNTSHFQQYQDVIKGVDE